MGEFVMFVTAAMIRKVLTELKKASEKMFQGEVTITKRDGWLIGTILVLTGIAVGLINAPLTHGINISIASNNGNNSGHNSSNNRGSYSDTGAVDGKAEDACGSLPKKEKETASKMKAAIEDKKAGACCKRRKKGMKKAAAGKR